MDDRKEKAPKAGERAKGAMPGPDKKRAANISQKTASHTTRRAKFLREDQTAIRASGNVGRTLRSLILAGRSGIAARECGRWACRLAAYIYDLRHKHGLEITMYRIQNGRPWYGRYVLVSPVTIVAGRR